MMIYGLAITSVLALSALAAPAKRQTTPFNINVVNKCPDSYTLGIFMLTSSGATQTAGPVSVGGGGGTAVITADYNALKSRLSLMDVNNQYVDQSLFEFGLGSAEGQSGTAYDLSLFGESVPTMQVVPANGACETKICNTANDYPEDQCWTNADQVSDGSPADTGCYVNGPTDFTVTYCV